MNTKQKGARHPLALALLAALATTGTAQAAIEIAQEPLSGGGSSIPPNIMVIFDDSGSMGWSGMPDDDYMINIAPKNIRYTTYTSNTIYYTPHFTYKPWAKADGTSYPNAPYTDVSASGTDLSGSVDLSSSTQCFHVPKDPAGSLTNSANFDRYQFRNNGRTYRCDADTNCGSTSGCLEIHGFTWTDDKGNTITRTIAEEKQNFANWYEYYRTRNKMAKASVGLAFAELDENYRVGFNTIWNRIDYPIPVGNDEGLFRGTNRSNWYNKMYSTAARRGTPLKDSLNRTGEYYERTDANGPWGPVQADGSMVSCRQSFTIFTTDGYYNSNTVSVGNQDNTNGPLITHANGIKTYQYTPKAPFRGVTSNTLADVAMKFWKNDLQPGLVNNVGVQTDDPDSPDADGAFWQHMVTFGISIGAAGSIVDQETAWPLLKDGSMAWPAPSNDKPTAVDDLWHAAVNSRGSFILANDPDKLTQTLKTILQSISLRANSGASGSVSGAIISSDSLFYKPRYTPGDWSGDLEAYKFNSDGTPSSVPYWKAAEKMPVHGDRELYTLKTDGTVSTFDVAGLDTTQKTALDNSNDLINYLRGDPAKELKNAGTYRNRTRPTGHEDKAPIADIVQSSPVYVASANYGYGFYQSWPEHDTYQNFVDSKKTWSKRVYVGSNDGILHSFDATTGAEGFGYVPSMLIPELKKLSDKNYNHQYYVDGLLAVDDAYLGGWKTVLVGNLGAGGKGWFALDVSNPGGFTAGNILWEMQATGTAKGKIKVDADLGQTPFGLARIVKMNNGDWAAVFGNGYNSTSGRAYLYIVKLKDGSLLAKLPAGASTLTENGLATPQLFDNNGDGTADYAYAGDIKGNMWKFDLTSSSAGSWSNALGTEPLFKADRPAGQEQPALAPPMIYKDPNTTKLYVAFGTGKYLADDDVSSTVVQSIYGFEDTNTQVKRGDMVERTIVYQSGTNRVTSAAVAGDMVGKKGWYLDLTNSGNKLGERVRAEPALFGSRLIVGTYQTAGSDVCAPEAVGWIMAFDLVTGSRPNSPFFDINRDGVIGNTGDTVTIGGEDVGISGFSPGVGGITGLTISGGGKPGEPARLTYSGSGGTNAGAAGGIGIEAPYIGRTGWKEISID